MKAIFFLLIFVVSSKLHQAVSLNRHGTKYHINGYYDGNSTKGKWGQLTPVGMRQHENLGQMLRNDYIDNLGFLQKDYVVNSIEVFSTNKNRTIQSVRSFLYGLYPLGSGKKLIKLPKKYYIPPYSNNTDSKEKDYILPDGYLPFAIQFNQDIVITKCDNKEKWEQYNVDRQREVYDEMALTYETFLKRMAYMFDIEPKNMNFSIINQLYDTLTVDRYLGRPMPNNFTEDDYQNIWHLHHWFNFIKISGNLSKVYNTGKLNRVLKNFDGRIANLNSQVLKWTFFSVHDFDISAMLLDLNISSAECVEEVYRKGHSDALNCDPNQQYASNIIFELHSDNEEDFYVMVRHNGKYVYLCEQRSTKCPYEDWKARVRQNIIISNPLELCFVQPPPQKTHNKVANH